MNLLMISKSTCHELPYRHSLIWFLNGDKKLSKAAKDLIENNINSNFISIASICEISIKIILGKLKFKNGFMD